MLFPQKNVFIAPAKATWAVLFMLLLFPGAVQAQVPQLFDYPENECIARMQHLLVIRCKDSNAVVTKTDSIKTIAGNKGDKKLEWFADLFSADALDGFREAHKMPPVALLQKKFWFESCHYPEIVAIYHYCLGRRFFGVKVFDKAFHYFILATDEMEKIGYANVPMAGNITASIAHLYSYFEDYPSAIKYSRISLQHPNEFVSTGYKAVFNYNNIGYYFLKMRNYDSAAAIFQQVMKQALMTNDTDYYGIGSGNYGNILRLHKKYREALPYFYTDISLNEHKVPANSATTCLYIANCLLYLDSVDKAAFYIEKSKPLAAGSYYQSSYHPTYYEDLALLYKKTGQYALSIAFQDSLLQLNDSLKTFFDTKVLMATTIRENEEKHLGQLRLKEAASANALYTRNLILGALIVLFGALLYAFWMRAQKEKLERIQKQLQAEALLAGANQQLEQFVAQLQEKNRVIEEIRSQVQEIAKTAPDENKGLDTLLNSSLLTAADWDNFKALFDKAHPGFIENLPGTYPGLSQSEIRLLVLQKLEINSKDMAAMLGISLASLRTAKYRLRKKYPELPGKPEPGEGGED